MTRLGVPSGLVEAGLDDTPLLEPPLGYVDYYNADRVPGVRRSIRLTPAGKGAQYLLVDKVYDTPEGQLCQAFKITTDWPHGQDIPMFSDFNIPRQVGDLNRARHPHPTSNHHQLHDQQGHLLGADCCLRLTGTGAGADLCPAGAAFPGAQFVERGDQRVKLAL